MSAPVPDVRIPSPRRPVGVAVPGPRATTRDAVVIPLPRAPRGSTGGGAHRLAVPEPRPAPAREAADGPAATPPVTPRHGPRTAGPAAGRHRVAIRGRALSPAARAFVTVARAGSLTTLAAMLVLAAAVSGLADGTAPTGPAAEVATATLR